MIPGPTLVYKCPTCARLLTKESNASGNTFGSKIYSDGKRISPMLPEYPDLTKCKKCDAIFWLSKLKKEGSYFSDTPENKDWQDADKAEFLSIDGYYTAINSGIAINIDEEIFMRQQIWWIYNDRVRNGGELFVEEGEELSYNENLQKLMNILNPTDMNQKIMMAEIKRNLGDFDGCMDIINGIEANDFNWVKEIFIDECKKHNKWLVELN